MEQEDPFVYNQVASWKTDGVIKWMNGLHQCLQVHTPQFLAHCICGSDLLKMSHQQLEYLKVTQVGHQELLLEAVELLSALEKARIHDYTFTLASNLSKKTSQLINTLTPPSSSKKRLSGEANAALSRVETTSAVMMAAKLLLSWLDRNPSNLLEDYDSFRTKILTSALDLASILMDCYDVPQMTDTCRAILKCTAVMMSPQHLSSMEPIKLLTVHLQPSETSGLGFSIQRTRQGNLVVNSVIPGSPASSCGLIGVGVEIVQINDQNVVGWEISNVIETLKASGHEVALVLNVGTGYKAAADEADQTADETDQAAADEADQPAVRAESPPGLGVPNGEVSGGTNGGTLEDESAFEPHQQDSSYNNDSSYSLTNQSADPPSLSTSCSEALSSSQDTLDDLAGSPASFEGDTDFSGMERVLVNTAVSLDLHRTSSAPGRERDGRMEASIESGSSVGGGGALAEEDKGSLYSGESGSLDCLDGAGAGSSTAPMSFVSRLKHRTASDGLVEKTSKQGKSSPKHKLPPVAYRTQVIGGVVVRVPIKPDEQEKSNQKRQRNSRRRAHHNRVAQGGGRSSSGGSGGGEAAGSEGGVVVGATPTGPEECGTPAEGEDGSSEKGKPVFSCKEVTVGGQTTRQVTVSSTPEIVGGSKKSSNPALMVPCFQLKDAQKEGFMCKLGGSGLTPKNWRRRWFVLKDKRLYYYKTAFDVSALGIVDMVGYTIDQSPESKKKYALKAWRQGARTYFFHAESSEDMTSWIECLKDAAEPDDQHNIMDSPQTIEASDDEL